MDNEQLIEAVRSYVEMYDPSHSKYGDSSHKDKLWKLIGQELNQPGPACKARWNNLRDNYRKSLKKRFAEDGQPAAKIKRYKYENQLSFLQRYFQKIENITNVPVEDSNKYIFLENTNFQEEDEQENTIKEEDDFLCDNETDSKDTTMISEKETVVEHEKPLKQFIERPPTTSFRKRGRPKETVSSKLMKYLLNENKTYTPTQTDPVDAFLAGIGATLKTFTPYYLNLAKTKIFSIVQEFEMVQIVEKQRETSAREHASVTDSHNDFYASYHTAHHSNKFNSVYVKVPSPSVSMYSGSPSPQNITSSDINSQSPAREADVNE